MCGEEYEFVACMDESMNRYYVWRRVRMSSMSKESMNG
jgi:hypothetical protein